MQLFYAPLTQRCPFCHALPDEWCRSRHGNTTGMHHSRKATVAGWTDEQKREALEEMLTKRRERRAQVAEVLALHRPGGEG